MVAVGPRPGTPARAQNLKSNAGLPNPYEAPVVKCAEFGEPPGGWQLGPPVEVLWEWHILRPEAPRVLQRT